MGWDRGLLILEISCFPIGPLRNLVIVSIHTLIAFFRFGLVQQKKNSTDSHGIVVNGQDMPPGIQSPRIPSSCTPKFSYRPSWRTFVYGISFGITSPTPSTLSNPLPSSPFALIPSRIYCYWSELDSFPFVYQLLLISMTTHTELYNNFLPHLAPGIINHSVGSNLHPNSTENAHAPRVLYLSLYLHLTHSSQKFRLATDLKHSTASP